MPVTFDALVDALAGALRLALREAPGTGGLSWVGAAYEQEKLYLGVSRGPRADGRPGFDESEVTRLDFLIGREPFVALCDQLREVAALPAPAGADADEWDEARSAFADLAALAALAAALRRLARELDGSAVYTVADDTESATSQARVPAVPLEAGFREALLAACPREPERALLSRLLDLGGPDAPALLPEVWSFLDARGG